jgi:hypothetical protein
MSSKQAERKKQKRAAKAKAAKKASAGGLREMLVKAARWPVSSAYVTTGWREAGSAGLLLFREHPEDGRVMTAAFYVDLWCMGVKSAHAQPVEDADTMLAQLGGRATCDACAPELVAAIVEAGRAYAADLGLPQDRDLPVVMELLRGLDPARAERVVTGREGQPFYLPGPDDDVLQVLSQLEKRLGPEQYDALLRRMGAGT